MKTTKKITGLFLVLCMVVSIVAVGAVPAAADTTYETYAQETVQGSNILHCFDWSYNNIKAKLPEIAAAGYTAVQTSPVQSPKDYNASWTDGVNQWWKLYQPLGFSVSNNTWLGNKTQLTSLCTEAEKYDIKVIVDVVANHVANNGTDGGTYSYINSGVESQLRNSAYYHTNNTRTNEDSRYNITQYHLGMPDLNTGNSTVQQRALSLLKECIDCGVDGFRFDAAKHIELPTDSSSFRSNFWPTVLNGATAYAQEQGVDTPFYYGEILGSAGPNFSISNYTTYMAVTDNQTGDRALDKAFWTAASELADGTYMKGASADKSVLWVESHDTYMGNSGSAWQSNTKDITSGVLNKAWAIVGARADSTGLFFARPNSTMGAASSDTNWKSTEVAEVNKFKNHFEGTDEVLSSSGNSAYIERGTKGVVISKLDGGGSVSLTANQMKSGTYTDQVTGNTFTVSGGTISGTVGSSGVAVVYNPEDDPVDHITNATLYLKPNSNWTQANARFAMFVYNSVTGDDAWVNMTAVGSDGCYSAAVPSGSWTNVIFCRMNPSSSANSFDEGVLWNQTNNLFPDDNTDCYTIASGAWSKGSGTWSLYGSTPQPTSSPATTAPTTVTPTSAPSSNTYTIYAINNASWSKVHVYWWNSSGTNPSWPGVAMTSISGTKVYSYKIPKDVEGLVFSDGASSNAKQTGNITTGITDGAVWTIGSASSNNYPVSAAPNYYLVGSMNNWSNNDNYKFSITATDSGKVEYKLSGVQLSAGVEIKVHSSSDTWHPSGDNYAVAETGTYDVYFRPNGDGNTDWYGGNESNKHYFNLVNVTPCTITWLDGDDQVLATETVARGETPVYTGETPTKSPTAEKVFTFNNTWSPTIVPVTADATYKAQFDESVRTYTVTWKNDDGTVLETDENVPYGTAPSYNGATPTKANDGATTYTFTGWAPQITSETVITADTVYTARFSSNTNFYTITWVDGDGNTLKTESYVQGVTPHYMGDTPTKTADAQYTYTFNGTWTPGVVAAEDDATYTANFDTALNEYTIQFKNEDGTVLQSSKVPYGTVPTYTGETPTKASTLTNSFVFNGWNTQPVAVTGEATYTATFTPTAVNTIDISVINSIGWDDVYVYYWLGDSNNTWPGVAMTPDADGLVYTASIPESAEAIIFNNGDTQHMKQTGDITAGIEDDARWAIYNSVDDDDVHVHLAPDYYLVGSMTSWGTTGASVFTPVKNADGLEEYKVTASLNSGAQIKGYGSNNTWYPDGMNNHYTVTATSDYEIRLRPNGDGDTDWHENVLYVKNVTTHTVTWLGDNASVLDTDTVVHGDTPAYTGETPLKQATAQYTYTFTGWKKAGDDTLYTDDFPAVTGDVTYTAQFSQTVRKYTVTWKDGDDQTLKTEQVAYGTTPSYTGETPTKTATAQYTYTFNNTWSPTIAPVTGDATYTAQFSQTVRTYTITWKDGDDQTLKTEQVAYGTTPSYTGETPTKTATAQYTYTFNNTWSPTVASVTGDATYTAQFNQTVRTYSVTWIDGDDHTLKTEQVAYNATPSYSGTTPTKTSDSEYRYTFTGWTDGTNSYAIGDTLPAVTKDATYTATFDSIRLPHFASHSISLDGAIGVYFYIDLVSDAPLNYSVTFTYGGETTDPISLDISMYDSAYHAYKVPFYVNSPDMTQDITANLYQTGIADPVNTSVFCVADYGKKLFRLDQTTLNEGDYYLTGDIGGIAYWGSDVQARWRLTENPGAAGEYMLEHVQLHEGDEFKIIAYHENGEHEWYPEEQNYTVSASEEGTCTVYFRPDGGGDTDYWHYGTIYVQKEANDLSELYELVRSTLNMGAKSQTYFNKHTDDLANDAEYLDYVPDYEEVTDAMLQSRIDAESTDFDSDPAVTAQLAECGLAYYGASAVLDSRTALRIYFRIDNVSKYDLIKDSVTFGGVDAAPVIATSNGRYVYFEYTNVEASNLNNSYTLSIGGNDYTYSVMEYLRLARDHAKATSNDALMELVTALYWYNVYADAYFGEV